MLQMLEMFRRPKWPQIPIDQIRGRTRLLVIDDQPFVYNDLFRRDGYNLEYWVDVQNLNDLTRGVYDLIILDISDIGRAVSADGGLGVLRHIKQANPTQIVIACSAKAFELKYKGVFDLADAAIDKSSDYVDMKARIDELLLKRFSLGFYLDHVAAAARPYTTDIAKLLATTQRAIVRNNPAGLEKFVRQHVHDKDAVNTILQVAQVAIGIMGLWRG